jgi:hypothetical protein
MKKEHVDLENGLVHIADSKTVNGIGDMPMTLPPGRRSGARSRRRREASICFPVRSQPAASRT